MLTLLTHPPASSVRNSVLFFKRRVRGILFFVFRRRPVMPYYGPSLVAQSLCKGLSELGESFLLDPAEKHISRVVGVLSGSDTLQWALEAKRRGAITHILAGPNIVVLPIDEGKILLSQEIDHVIVNSEWVKNLYLRIAPTLQEKMSVWAAGSDEMPSGQGGNTLLIYKKNVPEELFHYVVGCLRQEGVPFRVLAYGSYMPEEFDALLRQSRGMVYLTDFESQGMALQQAWMRNVATLVWNPGVYMMHGEHVPASSAPYLTSECGLFFRGKDDFKEMLHMFLSHLSFFIPQIYARKLLSHRVSARHYLDIVQKNGYL
ncbi:MAG: hypothetical protein KGI50_04580 [Patescibacteria group bacterium]|nr:hypothetical protein [Patescibacteria group bacterium]MDE2438436.1 hypothetical protein [Patescibacteria group bacterium]